jgi:hypothetical protein
VLTAVLLPAAPVAGHAQSTIRDSASTRLLRISIGGGFAENSPFRLAVVSSVGYNVGAGVEVRRSVPRRGPLSGFAATPCSPAGAPSSI